MNLSGKILRMLKWRVDASGAPDTPKCVICVAPHTSNWDFVAGYLAYNSIGRKANFLMKSSWFFFPLGILLRRMGGIPVRRGKSKATSLTGQVIDKIKNADIIHVALTPEGTRKAVSDWHTGFLRIAVGAKVPVQLALIDYRLKEVKICGEFMPTGDMLKDMTTVREFYAAYPDVAFDNEKFELPDLTRYCGDK